MFDVLCMNFRGCCDAVLCLLEAVGDLEVGGRDYTLQFRREQSFGKEKTIEGFG